MAKVTNCHKRKGRADPYFKMMDKLTFLYTPGSHAPHILHVGGFYGLV